MQLALTAEVLFPLVAGAVVAIAVIAIIVALGRGKQAPADDLTAADWTGESAAGDPASAVVSRVAVVGPHRLTVAEAVAVREADTAPLPVMSASLLSSTPEVGPAAAQTTTSDDASATPEPAPTPSASVPDPRPAATPAGSGRTVAMAVAQALAARAVTTTPRAEDARDRLLAVLLDDPARAVEAVEELEAGREPGEVLGRLVASGLSVDQLARLSGLPADQVGGLLAQHQRQS